MVKRLLVLDLEATCWEDKEFQSNNSEIIEIGFCFLDLKTKEISNPESIIVKPELLDISDYCTNLTSITLDQVTKGLSLKEACEKLKNEFYIHNYPLATYGLWDSVFFKTECSKKNIDYPFNLDVLNVKLLFELVSLKKKKLGLLNAMKFFNMSFEGNQHRADIDSYNTARLLRKILYGI